MSTLYIKILTDYFHHIIGDLEENRKNFLGKLGLMEKFLNIFYIIKKKKKLN